MMAYKREQGTCLIDNSAENIVQISHLLNLISDIFMAEK